MSDIVGGVASAIAGDVASTIASDVKSTKVSVVSDEGSDMLRITHGIYYTFTLLLITSCTYDSRTQKLARFDCNSLPYWGSSCLSSNTENLEKRIYSTS